MDDREGTEREPTQQTRKGQTIPVPKREDVFHDLEKVAKSHPSDGDASRPEQ